MNYISLFKSSKKLFFTADEAARILKIKPRSAHVLCARYVKKGLLLRPKKNFYIFQQKWENFSQEEFFNLANFLQVPSYISFASALCFYGATTQMQKNFFESASLRRSIHFDIKGSRFNFYKLKKEYYFDFVKKGDIFIATKEKALIDAAYLYSLGKYSLDFAALDLRKFDKKRLKKLIAVFPSRAQNTIKKICRI
jgi:predicted transcriptional regulator of viral defense system